MASSVAGAGAGRGARPGPASRDALLAVVVVVACCGPAAAQAGGFAREGFFIGIAATGNATVTGASFDGTHFFRDGEELLVVPRLYEERAYGVVVGGRFPRGAIEFAYTRSRHPASFLAGVGTADLHLFDINFRGFVLTGKRVQPWWLVALTVPALVAKDASTSRGDVGDARYGGIGATVGGGLSVYLHRRLALQGGYVYRWLMFSDARGVAERWKELDDVMQGRSAGLTTGLTFTF